MTCTFWNTSKQIKTSQRSTDSKQKLLNNWIIPNEELQKRWSPEAYGENSRATSCNKGNSYWMWGCGWARTGTTGCPERLHNLHPQRSHSLTQQGPDWGTWSKFEVGLALSRRLAKETSRSPFQSKSPCDSMKWCYCKCLAFTCASKSWKNPAATKQVYKKPYLFKNKHYLPIIL